MEWRIEQFLFNTNLNYLHVSFDFCILIFVFISISKDVLKIYYTYILCKIYNVWNKVVIRINYNKNKYNYRNYLTTYIYIKIYTNLNFSKKYINEISLKDNNSESKTNK